MSAPAFLKTRVASSLLEVKGLVLLKPSQSWLKLFLYLHLLPHHPFFINCWHFFVLHLLGVWCLYLPRSAGSPSYVSCIRHMFLPLASTPSLLLEFPPRPSSFCGSAQLPRLLPRFPRVSGSISTTFLRFSFFFFFKRSPGRVLYFSIKSIPDPRPILIQLNGSQKTAHMRLPFPTEEYKPQSLFEGDRGYLTQFVSRILL